MKLSDTIHSPDFLHISDETDTLHYGGSQAWYPSFWKWMAGCGPTTASHLLYYLAKTRAGCEALVPFDASNRKGFVRLLETVWNYVTPGMGGVNSTEKFVKGIKNLGQKKQIDFHFQVLDIDNSAKNPVSQKEMELFLKNSFSSDLPVAFLNLDHGALNNLESWHWVTLIGYHSASDRWIMYDQGRKVLIDMPLWLKTTKKGGGFVTVFPSH